MLLPQNYAIHDIAHYLKNWIFLIPTTVSMSGGKQVDTESNDLNLSSLSISHYVKFSSARKYFFLFFFKVFLI